MTNATMESVMKQVYGDWDNPSSGFPLPMPSTEAGSSSSGQRRYLWTDAFGVLNFVTLSMRASTEEARQRYLTAADSLVEATTTCLGTPRSPEFPMLANNRGGFKGMRIGKEHVRIMSDAGMQFDGMYWHYLDKWMFALFRLAQAKHQPPTQASDLIKDVHSHFLGKDSHGNPTGIYWKMNSDLSIIRQLEDTHPSDDALQGLIVYNMVHAGHPVLEAEILELRQVAQRYLKSGMRVTSDPLGYGLTWWGCQWLEEPILKDTKAKLRKISNSALDIRHGYELPFRLYGAIIGGKLSGDSTINHMAEETLSKMTSIEMKSPIHSPHSSINKVMFATALDPLSFQKMDDDPLLKLHV